MLSEPATLLRGHTLFPYSTLFRSLRCRFADRGGDRLDRRVELEGLRAPGPVPGQVDGMARMPRGAQGRQLPVPLRGRGAGAVDEDHGPGVHSAASGSARRRSTVATLRRRERLVPVARAAWRSEEHTSELQ